MRLDLHLLTIQEDVWTSDIGLLPQDGELHVFIKDLGYVLVVLNLSILEIISVNNSVMTLS